MKYTNETVINDFSRKINALNESTFESCIEELKLIIDDTSNFISSQHCDDLESLYIAIIDCKHDVYALEGFTDKIVTIVKSIWKTVVGVITKVIEWVTKQFGIARRKLIIYTGHKVFDRISKMEPSMESNQGVVRSVGPGHTLRVVDIATDAIFTIVDFAGNVKIGDIVRIFTPRPCRNYNRDTNLTSEIDQKIKLLKDLQDSSRSVTGLFTALTHMYTAMKFAVRNLEQLIVDGVSYNIVNQIGRGAATNVNVNGESKNMITWFYWRPAVNDFNASCLRDHAIELIDVFNYFISNKQLPVNLDELVAHITSSSMNRKTIAGYDHSNGFILRDICRVTDLRSVKYNHFIKQMPSTISDDTITYSDVGFTDSNMAHTILQVYTDISKQLSEFDVLMSQLANMAKVISTRDLT